MFMFLVTVHVSFQIELLTGLSDIAPFFAHYAWSEKNSAL